jgi:hypothetical protein
MPIIWARLNLVRTLTRHAEAKHAFETQLYVSSKDIHAFLQRPGAVCCDLVGGACSSWLHEAAGNCHTMLSQHA